MNLLALACALCVGRPPAPPASLPADTPAVWEAGLGHALDSFASAAWPDWQTTTLSVRRRFSGGSIAGEGIRGERFGATDWAGALDAYARTWSGGYGYVRAQLAPGADVLPRSDVQAELFHDLRSGWELSAGARRIAARDEAIPVYSASLARFFGRWSLRARGSAVPHAGATGGGGALLLRRDLGSPAAFALVAVSGGREVVTVGSGPRVEVRATRSVSLHLQRFLLGNLGIAGGAEYTRFSGIPDRRGVSLGLLARW